MFYYVIKYGSYFYLYPTRDLIHMHPNSYLYFIL